MNITPLKRTDDCWMLETAYGYVGSIVWSDLNEAWYFKAEDEGRFYDSRDLIEIIPILLDFNHSNKYTDIRR